MTTPSFAAAPAKRALERVVDDLYDNAKGPLKRRFNAWRNVARISKLYTHIRDIRKVKTIWQIDRAIDLKSFYYPSRVLVDNQRVTVNSSLDLPPGNLVIEGTVGQGKSIFFRFLTSQELYRAESIPVFIELRRIQTADRLMDHVIESFTTLGMQADERTIRFLMQQGRVTLLLDAFDELKATERTRISTEIERYAERHPKMRILISSRPGSGIASSILFRRIELAPLEQNELSDVIHRMADADAADRITTGLEHTGQNIAGLLTTPLMVALLIFRFRAKQDIPENLEAFYDDLFDVLLTRHDRLKPGGGYARPRSTTIGDAKLQETFDAFCFLLRRADPGVLTRRIVLKHGTEATELTSATCTAGDFVKDITSITCMLLEEGGEYKFVHRSVQEYHAACYIHTFGDVRSRQFYEAMNTRWHFWVQELKFLQTKDRFRFLKWFGISRMRFELDLGDDEPLPEPYIIPARVPGVFHEISIWWNSARRPVVRFLLDPFFSDLGGVEHTSDHGDDLVNIIGEPSYDTRIHLHGILSSPHMTEWIKKEIGQTIASVIASEFSALAQQLRDAEAFVAHREEIEIEDLF